MNKSNFQIIPNTHSIYKHIKEQFPELIKNIKEMRFVMIVGKKINYTKTFIWLTNNENKECIIQIKSILSGVHIKWNDPSSSNSLPTEIEKQITEKFGNVDIFVPFAYSNRFNQIIIRKDNSIICAAISKLLSDDTKISWDNIYELYEDNNPMTEKEIKNILFSLFTDCVKVEIIGKLKNTLTRVRIFNKEGKSREDTFFQLTKDKTTKLVDYQFAKKIDYREELLEEAKKRNVVLELPKGIVTSTTSFKYYEDEFRYITNYTSQKSSDFNFTNGKRIDLEHFISVIKTKIVNNLIIKSYTINGVSLKQCNIIFKCTNCGYEWETNGCNVMGNYKKYGIITCKQCVSHKIVTKRYAIECITQKHPTLDISKMYDDVSDENDIINPKKKYLVKCPCISKYGTPHGYFLTSYDLLINSECGCPRCNKSHMSQRVEAFLYNNHIHYKDEYPIKYMCDENKYNSQNQKIDFYLPELNIAIEVQGIQHYKKYHTKENYFMLGKEQWNSNDRRDKEKLKKLQSIPNLTILFFDDESSEKNFRGYKVIKNLNELSVELNIETPVLIETYTNNYNNYTITKLNEIKDKCRELYMNNKWTDLENSQNKEIHSLLYLIKKYKWLYEFKKEKERLNENIFLSDFLKEAEKYNFKKESFIKAHLHNDAMTIKAKQRGYLDKFLTSGIICVLPSNETYIFNSFTNVEKILGIDWRDVKKSVENKTIHMGLYFDYNHYIEYKNDEKILEKNKRISLYTKKK